MDTSLTEDGLPVLETGPWVREKHERLRRYVTISAGVRSMFIGPRNAGATYTELFCGPGRLQDRDSGQLLAGSSLVATEAAAGSRYPFTQLYISDADPQCSDATVRRLLAAGVTTPIQRYAGTADVVAPQIARALNRYALHLVFLDPFNLGALPFSIFEAFAPLRRVDLLMHVSAMDLQRNLEQAIDSEEGHHFDVFAPGWRSAIDTQQAGHVIRRELLKYWAGMVRSVGFTVFEEAQFEIVRGSRNQPLYWLALASKEEKAREFWEKIRHIEPQRGFGF